MRHAKKGNTQVKIYFESGSKTPYVVAVKLNANDWWRPLAAFDYEPDAEKYFNDLLA